MISFKKAFCALSFGIGLSASLNAWAIEPDCDVCAGWYQACENGDARSCSRYDSMGCAYKFPGCN